MAFDFVQVACLDILECTVSPFLSCVLELIVIPGILELELI